MRTSHAALPANPMPSRIHKETSMVLTSFLLLHLDAALLTHTDHLSRHSCSDRIVRDILCHDRARRNDAAISDVYARQNQNTVSDPNIVSDTDRQLGFKPLFHHRNIRPLKTVISCDNRDIRPHHHTAANVTSTINFGIDADSGIVTKSYFCRKGSIFLDIYPFSTIGQHPSSAKPA